MKHAGYGLFACLAVGLCSSSCGPRVGGIVVDRWSPLAEGAWSLEAGTEDAGWCKTIILPEEMYISAIRPIASPGTHHITLSLASPEDRDCTAGRFGPATVYAAVPGTGELRMPSQVAMRFAEGQAFHLNLHVYNPTSGSLDGVSGIEVVRVQADAVKHEASFALAGPASITLPPAKRTTITSVCRFAADQTAVALLPLMHDLGVQFKTTVIQGDKSTVIYDAPFRAEEQAQLSLGRLALRAGDSVITECTYENTKYHPVGAGHGDGEMCFSALLRYPREAPLECADPDDAVLAR